MTGLLKKLNIFSGTGAQEYIGIEFCGSTLKVVSVSCHGGRIEVLNAATRSIEGLPDDEAARILRQMVAECKAKKPVVVTVVPANLIITKNIEIPSTNPHEIREIISLQAGRHTPYSREEIIVDYINIGTYRRSYTKILLIIVARSVVKRQLLMIEKAGIPVEKVFWAAEGMSASLEPLLKEDAGVFPVALVHIDDNFTDFAVIFKGKPIFVRSVSIGAQHLTTERTRWQGRFLEEIRGSLEAYQNEDIERTPKVVILLGATSDMAYLEAIVAQTLRLPVAMQPYLKHAGLSPAALNATSVAGTVSFFNLVACLAGAKGLRVDLIPDEVKLKRAIEQRGRDLIKTGIFVLLVFLLLFLILLSKINFKSSYLDKLTEEHKVISVEARRLEKNLATISLIKSYMRERGVSLEVLTALYDLLPLTVELSDIRYDEQSKFTIRGTSESMAAVFALVEEMDKSPYFKNVKTKYTTKRKEGTKDLTDFEINCLLRTDKKP